MRRVSSHCSSFTKDGLRTGGWPLGLALLEAPPPSHHRPCPIFLPLLRVQVAAAHSDGEEAWRAVWGTVAVQETSHVKAKIHGTGQVVRVGIHPPNDLFSTGLTINLGAPTVYPSHSAGARSCPQSGHRKKAWMGTARPRCHCCPPLDLPHIGQCRRRTHPPSRHSCGLHRDCISAGDRARVALGTVANSLQAPGPDLGLCHFPAAQQRR